MVSSSKLWAVMAFGFLAGGSAYAQNSDFNLNSQRSESQDINVIPGKKLNHHGWIINPTPHQWEWSEAGEWDLSEGFNLKDVKGKFANQFSKLNKKGVALTIDFGEKKSAKYNVKAVSGAYALTVDKKGIQIFGYDERGAFYGIQTLKQLMESEKCQSGKLPYLTINDYPDLPNRGVVEGFYGTPWSHEVRLSLIDFYGKFKMNSYLYGPKDDPYHSCPNWRLPYPEKEAAQIKDLVEACNRNYVDFVWAIHPGQDIKWNEEDYQNLLNKFNLMYDLGVRAFAIFFDDISGEGANPEKQVDLLNRLTKEFVQAKGDVSPLTVCPTDYTKLWANPTQRGSLVTYGKSLDPSIKVFWTGDVVCSDLTKETMDWVNSRIKRPAYYWWNFPVTDYARHIIMQGPTYGLDTSLTADDLCGLVSNPMEHGEASKLALYGVSDYDWNISAYNAMDNWERGLAYLTPEAKDAYRTFAIHSCDTETGYRRAESWETKTFNISNYTQAEYDALLAEFKKISKVEEQMKSKCTNQLLLKELAPWLTEFTKLGVRGTKALELLDVYKKGYKKNFWRGYLENLMTADGTKAYEAHKSGTMKMQPFYETAMDDMRDGFYKDLTGKQSSTLKGIGSFATLKTTQSKLMFDNDSTTYYHSGASQSQKGGDWVGVDLGQVKDVWEVNILQGRNSVDDVDYLDHAKLEYSADGKNWTSLIADMEKRYIIHWEGESVKARYVRLVKLPSDKRSWVAIRSFEVNPVKAEKLGFTIEGPDAASAVYAFDNHLGTSYKLSGTLTFGVPAGTKSYTLLLKLKDGEKLEIKQLSDTGKLLSTDTVIAPLHQFVCAKEADTIQIKGNAEIFEIVNQ